MKGLQAGDYIVFLIYFIVVAAYGYYVYKRKSKSSAGESRDFFLA